MLNMAKLPGLDPGARDKEGHTPNECFLSCREAHCAVTRKPVDVERRAWANMMSEIRAKDESSIDGVNCSPAATFKSAPSKRKDSFAASEASEDSDSDEEYLDAEDDYTENENLLYG